MAATLPKKPALRLVLDNGYYRGVTISTHHWLGLAAANFILGGGVGATYARDQAEAAAAQKPAAVAAETLPAAGPAWAAEPPWHALGPHTFVMHDEDRRVTCWGTKYGMSCLPDKAFRDPQ